jgi:hypothetical protein
MTSAYKIASNHSNVEMFSTGPKTAEGKRRSRLNGLKHGLSAQTAVLPDEDPEAFAEQRDALIAALKPFDEVDLALAETMALARWRQQRCVRAEAGMIAQKMQQTEQEAALKEHHEVNSLGRRLFADRRGDARLYPHDCLLIFVASHVADPRDDRPFSELEREFVNGSSDYKLFMRRLRERPWRAPKPRSEAGARQKLAGLVEKATARLEVEISRHPLSPGISPLRVGVSCICWVFVGSGSGSEVRRIEAPDGRRFRAASRPRVP